MTAALVPGILAYSAIYIWQGKHGVQDIHVLSCRRWTEHDPQEIWASVTTCIDKALEAAEQGGTPVRVVAAGITNQRETTLLWDRASGLPLHNAIVWLDTRTGAICERLAAQLSGGTVSEGHALAEGDVHWHLRRDGAVTAVPTCT